MPMPRKRLSTCDVRPFRKCAVVVSFHWSSATCPYPPRSNPLAQIRPFSAIRYARRENGPDVSNVIAPPFDVQDEASKAALQAKDPHNIVNVDLPHIPP